MADYVLAVRLDPADKARLEALVADDRARVEALGLAARPSPAETVRGLLRREVKARGLLNAAPAALATPPPAPPPAASSPGQQDQVLSQLVRLGAKATGGLVDAAALVRASGLSTTDAHAALYALRDAGQVELRADTSPDLRQPADEPLRPRTQAGEVVGYVARIGGSKMTTPKASKPAARPPEGQARRAHR